MTQRLSPIVSALLLSIMISIDAGAGSAPPSWHPSGYGGGGRFTSIAVDPLNPQIVYIGSDVAGIFRSQDGGNRFELRGKGLESFIVADIAINPAPPHQLVAMTNEGLYYSTNHLEGWVRIPGDTCYTSTFFGSNLLLFTQNSLWIGTDIKGVFKLPLSNLKSAPEPVPGLDRTKVNGLTVYDGYLYAGTSRGVYRLEDKNWKLQHQGLLQRSVEINDIASSQNVLYIIEKQSGLFRWNAKDQAWEKRPVSLESKPKSYKSLLVHPNNPNLVFISAHPEEWPHLLYKTQDGGATWKSILSFRVDPKAPSTQVTALTGIEEIAFVPGTSQSLFLVDWWNLWQSTDTGESWLQRHHDTSPQPESPLSMRLG
jgi:photosystem II stability/assembly factor-like uncharacterized protein